MLVLSRKQGKKVHIGDNVTITVLGVRGGVVKLGINAPPEVRVLRGELPNWFEPPPDDNAAANHCAEQLTV